MSKYYPESITQEELDRLVEIEKVLERIACEWDESYPFDIAKLAEEALRPVEPETDWSKAKFGDDVEFENKEHATGHCKPKGQFIKQTIEVVSVLDSSGVKQEWPKSRCTLIPQRKSKIIYHINETGEQPTWVNDNDIVMYGDHKSIANDWVWGLSKGESFIVLEDE